MKNSDPESNTFIEDHWSAMDDYREDEYWLGWLISYSNNMKCKLRVSMEEAGRMVESVIGAEST